MTRIAILADIHGNLPALEAVLADIAHMAPDQVVVNGDVINRGPQSQETLSAVRATGWPVVFGNHEEYILKYADGELPDKFYADVWLPSRSTYEALNAEEVAYLRTLPWHWVVDVPGLPKLRIEHGSPRALNDGLGFWLPDDELTAIGDMVPERVLIGAHTHRPFDRRVGKHWFLNTGAVGVPFNGDPAAQYLVLDGAAGEWQANFRAVPYDRAPVYAAWERSGQLERSTIARVFQYEVKTATFHLMAFERFCEKRRLPVESMESFELYLAASQQTKPGRSLKVAHEAPAADHACDPFSGHKHD